MKKVKLFLIVCLLIHVFCLLSVNIISFKKFSGKEIKKLNPFGQFYLKNFQIEKIPKELEIPISIYTNLTGINRGYEFFSPNVSGGKIKIIFSSENKFDLQLLKSPESQIKLLTLNYYINSILFNKELRDSIIKSICLRLFENNPEIKEINVYLEIHNYNNLNHMKNINSLPKIIKLSKITKNENR